MRYDTWQLSLLIQFNIWDLENPTQPYPAPNRGTRVEDIEAAAWNRKVPHILATASSNGFTSIWDLKASREVLHLKTPDRKRVSTLAWDPDNALKIITGSDDDLAPLLHVWDLRNTKAPSHVSYTKDSWLISSRWRDIQEVFYQSTGVISIQIYFCPVAKITVLSYGIHERLNSSANSPSHRHGHSKLDGVPKIQISWPTQHSKGKSLSTDYKAPPPNLKSMETSELKPLAKISLINDNTYQKVGLN